MGKDSHIQWTDHTHNFWEGCKKVSDGCKFCYAERMFSRFGKDFSKVRRIGGFENPLAWKKPALVFTCSTSDFFIEDADRMRNAAWDIIRNTPHLTYQILTKRPERIIQCLPADWGSGWDNVWLGVSVENQKIADERISKLLFVPAKTRFISAEPLLGFLNIYQFLAYGQWDLNQSTEHMQKIHWVIIGGESGNETGQYRYRPCNLKWIDELKNQCYSAGIPCFIKQLGSYLAKHLKLKDRFGGDIAEFPENLRVRAFPVSYNTKKEESIIL